MFLLGLFGVIGFFSFHFARSCDVPKEFNKYVLWMTLSCLATTTFASMGSYYLKLFLQ